MAAADRGFSGAEGHHSPKRARLRWSPHVNEPPHDPLPAHGARGSPLAESFVNEMLRKIPGPPTAPFRTRGNLSLHGASFGSREGSLGKFPKRLKPENLQDSFFKPLLYPPVLSSYTTVADLHFRYCTRSRMAWLREA